MAQASLLVVLYLISTKSIFPGDPLDIKMYESTKWDLIEGKNIPVDLVVPWFE